MQQQKPAYQYKKYDPFSDHQGLAQNFREYSQEKE